MNRKLYTVSGKFIIPGTRTTARFSCRVFAADMRQGSADLVGKLQEEYGWTADDPKGKAPRGYTFSKDFALMNLQWKEHPIVATAPKVKEDEIIAALAKVGAIISEDNTNV